MAQAEETELRQTCTKVFKALLDAGLDKEAQGSLCVELVHLFSTNGGVQMLAQLALLVWQETEARGVKCLVDASVKQGAGSLPPQACAHPFLLR